MVNGVSIADVNIADVKDKISNELLASYSDKEIRLVAVDKSADFKYSDIDVKYDIDKIANEVIKTTEAKAYWIFLVMTPRKT